jgi:hypothetical protein
MTHRTASFAEEESRQEGMGARPSLTRSSHTAQPLYR